MAEITKEEWLRRCAQRYIDKSGIAADSADVFAEACWDQRTSDADSPEDATDADMEYWEDD